MYVLFDEFDSGFTLVFMIMEKRLSWCNEIEVWNGS